MLSEDNNGAKLKKGMAIMMEISNVELQPMPTGSTGQKNDLSAEIQKLEQLKRGIKQQLKQLEQSKQGGNTVENAKSKLQKKLKEVEQQIQVLKQQETAEVKPTEKDVQDRPPRFDKYEKNDQDESGAGIYAVENDENGSPVIVFDSPEKPQREAPDPHRHHEKLKSQRQ